MSPYWLQAASATIQTAINYMAKKKKCLSRTEHQLRFHDRFSLNKSSISKNFGVINGVKQ